MLVEGEIGHEIELGVAEGGEVVHEGGDRVHVVGAQRRGRCGQEEDVEDIRSRHGFEFFL